MFSLFLFQPTLTINTFCMNIDSFQTRDTDTSRQCYLLCKMYRLRTLTRLKHGTRAKVATVISFVKCIHWFEFPCVVAVWRGNKMEFDFELIYICFTISNWTCFMRYGVEMYRSLPLYISYNMVITAQRICDRLQLEPD